MIIIIDDSRGRYLDTCSRWLGEHDAVLSERCFEKQKLTLSVHNFDICVEFSFNVHLMSSFCFAPL